MAERLGVTADVLRGEEFAVISQYCIPIEDHPRISVYNRNGAYMAGQGRWGNTELGYVEYFGVRVDFDDQINEDSILVHFAEKPDNFGAADGLVMIVSTELTGARLILGTLTKRDTFEGGLERYSESQWWTKINEEDESVLIASRRGKGENHVLDNQQGAGYLSPLGVTLKLVKDGKILIIPND